MKTISYPTHIDADLLPDSRLALVAITVSILGIQFDVQVAFYTLLIFSIATVVSLWYAFSSDDRSAFVVFEARLKLFVGYLLGAVMIVLLAAVLDHPPGLQRFAFAVVSGLETAFALATLARILPTFRPAYNAILSVLHKHTPFDESLNKEIDDILDDSGRDNA